MRILDCTIKMLPQSVFFLHRDMCAVINTFFQLHCLFYEPDLTLHSSPVHILADRHIHNKNSKEYVVPQLTFPPWFACQHKRHALLHRETSA